MGYYMGDYYRGDPGLFGSLAKVGTSLVKRVAGAVIKRTPIGAAVGIAGGVLGGLVAKPTMQIPIPGTGIRIKPSAAFPGGEPLFQRSSCPPGYHLDKRYGATCVRNRSMNPANPRALRRAIRRQKGFISLAKRALKGTGVTIGRKGSGGGKRGGRCKKCR